MKKSMKHDAKLDFKMDQTWTPKRAKNPTISRQDPDTPPRRETGVQMDQTWSQTGFKKGVKIQPNSIKNK